MDGWESRWSFALIALVSLRFAFFFLYATMRMMTCLPFITMLDQQEDESGRGKQVEKRVGPKGRIRGDRIGREGKVDPSFLKLTSTVHLLRRFTFATFQDMSFTSVSPSFTSMLQTSR